MTIERVEDLIGATLSSALRPTRDAEAPDDLASQLLAASTGGKRFRARLLLAAHEAFGGAHAEAAESFAAAIELFQLAALVHDDVLDGSDTRRGRPALHRALESSHAAGSREGDAAWSGISGAVLAGDLVLVVLPGLLARGSAAIDAARGARATALFAEMGATCTTGQILDMRLAETPLADLIAWEDDARRVMLTKTASYTAEHPLAIAATLAGADEEAIRASREAGRRLGVAFQLRDDVLGLIGDEAVTGKPSGDDIVEGKRTLLVAWAWAEADAGARAVLTGTLGDRTAPPARVREAVEVIRASGALERAEVEIESDVSAALELLDSVNLTADGREQIAALARAAAFRSA